MTLVAVGAVLVGLLIINTLVIAPYNLSYFNPLLGGSGTGRANLLVGWGEGLEQAGSIIDHAEGGCTHRRVAVSFPMKPAFVCQRPVFITETGRLERGDYIVLYVDYIQRIPRASLHAFRRFGRRIGVVRIRGIEYAEVIRFEGPHPGA